MSIRWDRVREVRKKIAEGFYDDPDRVGEACEAILKAIDQEEKDEEDFLNRR